MGAPNLPSFYCPNLCPESAYRKLKHWIELYPGLCDDLAAVGTSSHSRTYTSAQVSLIAAALGEP